MPSDFTDPSLLTELNERSRDVFCQIVDAYMTTGEPIGSRTLSGRLSESISPATVRNVMSDLEELGLLAAPHISAGRVPTEQGLRLYVSGLMELGDLAGQEREALEAQCHDTGQSLETLLTQAGLSLAGLSRCASLVAVPSQNMGLKQIEFVALSPGKALAIMVDEADNVENRVIDVPKDLPGSALMEASNFLNARIAGRTLADVQEAIGKEHAAQRKLLNKLSSEVIEAGIAAWAGGEEGSSLIVRGHSNLLNDVSTLEQLDEIKRLFGALEAKQDALDLLSATKGAGGIQIFIGSENKMFEGAGLSMIVSPYQNMNGNIIGAIGVVGPTRINYARIIPMVDYTARMIGRIIG